MQVNASKPSKKGRFFKGTFQSIMPDFKVCPKFIVFTGIALAISMPASIALGQDEEDWWFDVEVIAFKRNTAASQIEEDFSSNTFTSTSDALINLLSLPLYQKANPLIALQRMLYECSTESLLLLSNLPVNAVKTTAFTELPHNQLAPTLSLDEQNRADSTITDTFAPAFSPMLLTSEERLNILLDANNCSDIKKDIAKSLLVDNVVDNVPSYLNRPELNKTENAHLLADSQLNLVEYAKNLFAQRDIKALGHLAWRQPVVFGEDNADFYRVFFGKKLSLPALPAPTYEDLKQTYDPVALNVIDQNSETFFDELNQQLAEKKKVNWNIAPAEPSESITKIDKVWEMDGMIKVYLNYVNRVPYLHVESEFQFSEMSLNTFAEAQIEQYPFKQRRRLISKQIHYFDHPKMGLIIRLQRYEKPKEVDNEDIY